MPTLPSPEAQATPVPSPTAQRPLASPTPEPAALVLEVWTEPQVAGPGDKVQFLLQTTNVGRGPAHSVKIEGLLPDELLLQSLDCNGCATSQEPGRLTLTMGYLSSGAQMIASVFTEVIEDAWPGQTVLTEWRVTADGLVPQSVQASLELPWAELPATGWIGDDLVSH